MKNKILNEKIITDVTRDIGMSLEDTRKVIKCYFDHLREELINGMEIKTPLGNLFISKRRLNTNVSDKTITHKLNYKIDKNFQNFLDSES